MDISVEDSVRPQDGEGKAGLDAAHTRIYNYVSEKLIQKVNEVEAELNQTKG